MKKRLTFVLILLTWCIIISIGSYLIISYMSEDLTNNLDSFLINAESNDNIKAISSIDSCLRKLEVYEKIYAIFLDHSLFESIMITIPSIKHLYETGNRDEAMDKCFESIETLKIIVHEQKLTIENIF